MTMTEMTVPQIAKNVIGKELTAIFNRGHYTSGLAYPIELDRHVLVHDIELALVDHGVHWKNARERTTNLFNSGYRLNGVHTGAPIAKTGTFDIDDFTVIINKIDPLRNKDAKLYLTVLKHKSIEEVCEPVQVKTPVAKKPVVDTNEFYAGPMKSVKPVAKKATAFDRIPAGLPRSERAAIRRAIAQMDWEVGMYSSSELIEAIQATTVSFYGITVTSKQVSVVLRDDITKPGSMSVGDLVFKPVLGKKVWEVKYL